MSARLASPNKHQYYRILSIYIVLLMVVVAVGSIGYSTLLLPGQKVESSSMADSDS